MAATIGTRIHTFLRGKQVGKDAFGNRYYEARGNWRQGAKKKRWVIYAGKAEPSKVPAEWHGWLHYTRDALPDAALAKQYRWQRQHLPNLTGTKHRYLPDGHLLQGGARAKSAADYEAWSPEK